MFRRSTPAAAGATDASNAPISLDQPHDTCFRCGRPTPVGVSLCERDNPGRIKSPSSTQVHGTILIGVLGGFVGLLVLLRLVSSGVGPFSATVTGVATHADGGIEVALLVTNNGTRASGASCRISPGGAPDYHDFVFFTDQIPPGESRQFSQTLPPPDTGHALLASSVAVRCT